MRGTPYLLSALVAAAGMIVIARLTLLVVRVDGASMLPTFHPGDAVLTVRRFVRPTVRRGDVVVCRLPKGIPGPDSYLVKRVLQVEDGRVFVGGDGDRSYDSRTFGPIPLDHVVGHVVARLSRH